MADSEVLVWLIAIKILIPLESVKDKEVGILKPRKQTDRAIMFTDSKIRITVEDDFGVYSWADIKKALEYLYSVGHIDKDEEVSTFSRDEIEKEYVNVFVEKIKVLAKKLSKEQREDIKEVIREISNMPKEKARKVVGQYIESHDEQWKDARTFLFEMLSGAEYISQSNYKRLMKMVVKM